jgi:hypothetical protein
MRTRSLVGTALVPEVPGVPVADRDMAKIPLNPSHPERVCWGCDKLCPADDLRCGNGTVRTMHPCELFGDDWLEWTQAAPSG